MASRAFSTLFFADQSNVIHEWHVRFDKRIKGARRQAGWSHAPDAYFRVVATRPELAAYFNKSISIDATAGCTVHAVEELDGYFNTILNIIEDVGTDWILVDSRGIVLGARRDKRVMLSDLDADRDESLWLSLATQRFAAAAPSVVPQHMFQNDFQ